MEGGLLLIPCTLKGVASNVGFVLTVVSQHGPLDLLPVDPVCGYVWGGGAHDACVCVRVCEWVWVYIYI